MTSTIPTKELFLDSLNVYRNACSTGEAYLADEITIEYLLEYGVDMSDAHGVLAGIAAIDNYDLIVS